MIKIGITGGIGSGKTTVCKIFEVLGIPIYYADDRAKELLESDKNVIKKVKNIFGDDVYNEQGKLDRHRVATIVFNFPETLAEYNAIIHPAVFQDAEKWMLRHTQHEYVIKEAALLFETGSYKMLDKIICVTAPVKRLEDEMESDDYIIYNDGSTPLIRQVLSIHEKILIYAKM